MSALQERWRVALAVLVLVPLASSAAYATEPTTRATGGFQAERSGHERRQHETLRDYAAARGARPNRGGPSEAQPQKTTPCCDFRIFEAATQLFDDYDLDGYYTYLRVGFDVDTDYASADVYADVYLVDSAGVFTSIYQSDLFTIYGSAGDDDYEIEAELVAGFPPDDYDVLIEIYDAFDDRLVVEYGALDSSALSLLPMEDISYDTLTPVVHSHGGGGALSAPMLWFLFFGIFLRKCAFRLRLLN